MNKIYGRLVDQSTTTFANRLVISKPQPDVAAQCTRNDLPARRIISQFTRYPAR